MTNRMSLRLAVSAGLGALGSLTAPVNSVAAQDAGAPAVIDARVSGTVYDSVALRPLVGATVRIFRASDPSSGRTTTSDKRGQFTYDSVASGVWLASFLHPKLDSLRIEPVIARLEINQSGTVRLPLFIPTARALVAATCGNAATSDDGLLVGEVRGAGDNAAVSGATIAVEWPEWLFVKKKLATEIQRRTTRTDAAGRYAICGVPAGSTLRAFTFSGADSSGAIEVAIPADGYTLQDFALAPVEYVAVSDAPTDSAALFMRRGRAVVRGRVVSVNGTPLANATVRVIGSGSLARTTTDGAFTIVDAAAGTQTIEARAIGFQPSRTAMRLRDGAAADIALTLPVRNVSLDTVRVTAGRDLPFEVRGIERRWRSGLGSFMDGKTVRDRSSFYTTDALRSIAGVYIRSSGSWGQDIYMRNLRGEECRAIVFVDGMPMDAAGAGGFTIDDMAQPAIVAAVEVYARASMVPAEYMTMGRNCGVVAVWTKYATEGVTVLPPKSGRPAR